MQVSLFGYDRGLVFLTDIDHGILPEVLYWDGRYFVRDHRAAGQYIEQQVYVLASVQPAVPPQSPEAIQGLGRDVTTMPALSVTAKGIQLGEPNPATSQVHLAEQQAQAQTSNREKRLKGAKKGKGAKRVVQPPPKKGTVNRSTVKRAVSKVTAARKPTANKRKK